MKITAVKTHLLEYRVGRAFGPSTAMYPYRTTLMVKITTDEGLVGWERLRRLGGAQAVIERQLGPMLIGQDPLMHRKLWRQMWSPNYGGLRAVAAVDIALQDLRGKALGLPLAELYGGRLRDPVPAYASALNYQEGLDPEQHYLEEATCYVEQGFRALKMRLGRLPMARDVAAATTVREVVGPEIRLMADGNGAYSLVTAIQMGRELGRLGFLRSRRTSTAGAIRALPKRCWGGSRPAQRTFTTQTITGRQMRGDSWFLNSWFRTGEALRSPP